MQRLVRYTSWFCASLAILMVLGRILLPARTETGSLYFVPAVHQFKEPLEKEQKYGLTLTLRNGTNRTVSILGAPGFCGPDGCAKLAGFPQIVKPGANARIDMQFEAGLAGLFHHEIPIYTDHPSQPQVMLHINGEVANKVLVSAPEVTPLSETTPNELSTR